MDKRSVLVVSLLSLLVLFSFRGYAELIFVSNTSSISGNYDPNFIYIFNSAWINNTLDENITDCNFTLGRPDGSIIWFNSTGLQGIDENPKVFINISTPPSLCFINFTQDELGSAGNYNWTWSAKNDTNYWVTNYTYNFIIQKASPGTIPIHLFLNGTEGNKINLKGYNLNDLANFSVFLDTNSIPYELGNKTLYLYSNFTSWNVQNSNNATFFNYTLNLNNLGSFNLTSYWYGDSNYSLSNQTYFFTVTDLKWSSNTSSGPTTYIKGGNYSFQINWTGSVSKVLFDWNGNNSSYVNTTGNIYWVNLTDLPAGIYNYSWYANDTNNFWSSSDMWNYNVSQILTTLSMTVSSTSVTAGSSVTFSCYVTNNNPIPSPSLQVTLSAGTCTGPNNFTSCSVTVPSVADTYNYICSTNGNVNYTSALASQIILVQGASSGTGTGTGTGDTGTTPAGTFTIENLISSLTMNAGESKSTAFSLKNTLSAGTLSNVTISVSGINSSWYSLSTSKISSLYRNRLENLTLTFKIPSDAEAKNYDVTITATGKPPLESTRTATKAMKLTVTKPEAAPSLTAQEEAETTENKTQNITSNQTTSGATGLAPAFEFFKNNLVIILAVAACLLIFIFRNNLTTALTGTLGKEEAETHKAKTASPLKGIKDKLNYKLIVNLKKESKAKSLKETKVQGTEMVPEKEPKRPAVLENEIKRDIKELQSIIENENKVKKNKKRFSSGNN